MLLIIRWSITLLISTTFLFEATAQNRINSESILDSAKSYLIQTTSESFVDSYCQLIGSFKSNDWVVRYGIFVKPHAVRVHEVTIVLNGKGEVIKGVGIPNCKEFPSECQFPFGKEEILRKAENLNFGKGIGEWEIEFYWHYGEINSFIWCVTNHLSEADGENLIFDANSGELLEKGFWTIEY